jgi:hypothetical protein
MNCLIARARLLCFLRSGSYFHFGNTSSSILITMAATPIFIDPAQCSIVKSMISAQTVLLSITGQSSDRLPRVIHIVARLQTPCHEEPPPSLILIGPISTPFQQAHNFRATSISLNPSISSVVSLRLLRYTLMMAARLKSVTSPKIDFSGAYLRAHPQTSRQNLSSSLSIQRSSLLWKRRLRVFWSFILLLALPILAVALEDSTASLSSTVS